MISESHKTTITIEARDLDTDERSRTTIAVVAPQDPGRQRAVLADAVAEPFPGAKLRSYADGAATFLDRQHLIIASYAELPDQGRRRSSRSLPLQDALFAP